MASGWSSLVDCAAPRRALPRRDNKNKTKCTADARGAESVGLTWGGLLGLGFNRIQKDGTVFKGTFKENKPVKGSYVFASTGNVATGAFDKGGGFIQTATA